MAWGGLKLISNNNSAGETAVSVTSPDTGTFQHNEQSALTNENSSLVLTGEEEEARNDAALEASKKVYASIDIPKIKSKAKVASGFYFTNENIAAADPDFTLVQPKMGNLSLEDRYYMMITKEGKVIRMSKKLGHIACCISGEEHDTECINQLKKWQEKLASQHGTNSPGNFMDLLSLVNALEEK
ncbi:MAG: hypothetical protein IPH18_00175 [Chitinophagaceae bacterium]|nr:hypothetical protein [Chitinophagaceae bacterium]